LRAAFAWLGRLDDDQPSAIEEEGVIAKQSIELSHCRMIVRHSCASNWLKVRSTICDDIFIGKLLWLGPALSGRFEAPID